MTTTTDSADAAIERGLAALKTQQWQAAYGEFEALERRFPDDERPFIYAAEALFGAGRLEEAFAHIAPAAQRFREGSPWSNLLAAKLQLRRGETADALARLRDVLDRFPRIEPMWSLAAEALAERGLLAEAAALLARAAEHFPDAVPIRVARAKLITLGGGADDIAAAWSDLVRRFPDAPEIYLGAADAFAQTRRLERTVVAIYGNCQANYITEVLNLVPSVAQRFLFIPVLNHAAPGFPIAPVPQEAQRAALLWQQYDREAKLETRDRLREEIPGDCVTVSFPALIFLAFWPFAAPTPEHRPEPAFPFGRYPWADRVGLRVAEMELDSADDAYETYMRLTRERMPAFSERVARDRFVCEERDRFCDVTMTDYIFENLRTEYQFWTWGHPSGTLVRELIRRLWRHSETVLGPLTPQIDFELDRVFRLKPGVGEEQLPIHPDVVRDGELRFCSADSRYTWHAERLSFRDYIVGYIDFHRPSRLAALATV